MNELPTCINYLKMRGALLLAALGIILEVRGDKQAPFRGDKPQQLKKRGKLIDIIDLEVS
jgi:hypothetical protein